MLEQELVNYFSDDPQLCNIATDNVKHTRIGVELSNKAKNAIRKAHLGQKRTDEARTNMSVAHKGVRLSDSHRKSLSEGKIRFFSTKKGKKSKAAAILKISHRVSCAGKVFESKSSAARELGVDVTTILYRVKNKNYPDYFSL
jgi:hypothetical protein